MPAVVAAAAVVLAFAGRVGAVRVVVVIVAARPSAPAFTSAPVAAERAAAVLDVAMGGAVGILGTVALFRFRFRFKGLADACTSCCGCCCCLCVDATTDDTIAAKTLTHSIRFTEPLS